MRREGQRTTGQYGCFFVVVVIIIVPTRTKKKHNETSGWGKPNTSSYLFSLWHTAQPHPLRLSLIGLEACRWTAQSHFLSHTHSFSLHCVGLLHFLRLPFMSVWTEYFREREKQAERRGEGRKRKGGGGQKWATQSANASGQRWPRLKLPWCCFASLRPTPIQHSRCC